jgi:uncharacterized protein involved in outer membrane biogenesis
VSDPFSILELRRQSGARARRARRWRLSLIVGVVLLVVLGLTAVVFIAPPFVKRQLEHRLTAALHRKVAIRDLQLNPWILSTTIDGIAIDDRDGHLLFGCERLYIHFDLWSFFSGQWIFKEISLTAPVARLEVNQDGTLNISDLLAPSAEKSPAPGKPRPIRIGQLVVSQAQFTFADHSHAQDFSTQLGPIGFSLENFSTVPVAPGAPYEFTASTEAGESLHWRGTLSADPLRSAGDFSLGRIVLKKYAPYYAGLVHGDVLAGTLDVAGRYELDLSVRPCVMKIADGELHLHGLQLALRGTIAPVIDLPAADLTGLEASLVPLKISAARLDLAGGKIALQRAADGTLNLAEIFAAPADLSPPAAPSFAPPDVALAALEVHGLALTLDDATTPHPAHNAIAALNLSAQGISLAPGAPPIPFDLALRFSPQGVMTLKGSFAPASRRADLAVDLTGFPLAGMTPYLEPLLNLRITEGTVFAHGQLMVAVPAEAAPQILYRGDAELDRVTTVDGGSGEGFASFASLGFKQLDFSLSPLALAVGQISFIEPSFHFTIYHGGPTNLDTVLRHAAPENSSAKVSLPAFSPGESSAARPPAAGMPRINIDRIVVTNGSLIFTDRSIEPNAGLTVGQLAGLISGFSSGEGIRTTIDLRAEVDNSEPVAIAGQISPFDSDMFADLTAGCDNIDLQPASPYLGKYAGYVLAGGSLALDVKIHLEQHQLDSQNIVTLNQFTLGEKTNSPDATGLPVRFAIALLKDVNGKIVIDLPVQGRLDDPSFRIGRVVLRIITNLLAKTATEPFALLGSMFGGASQPLDHIDFKPGASLPDETGDKTLNILARALVARPGLALDVAGDANIGTDQPALERQKLRQLLRTKIWEIRHNEDPNLPPVDEVQISPDELDRALVSFYFMTFHPGPVHARIKTAEKSQQPAQRSRDYFHPMVEASTPSPAPAAAPQSAPPVATLTLQEMVARLAPRQQVDDSDFRQLALDRAQQVADYLIALGVSPTRISVADSGARSAPRVTLQLK